MNRAVGNWMQQKNLSGIMRGLSESLLPFSITHSCRDHDVLKCGPCKSHRSFLVSVFAIVFMVLGGWCLDRREKTFNRLRHHLEDDLSIYREKLNSRLLLSYCHFARIGH